MKPVLVRPGVLSVEIDEKDVTSERFTRKALQSRGWEAGLLDRLDKHLRDGEDHDSDHTGNRPSGPYR